MIMQLEGPRSMLTSVLSALLLVSQLNLLSASAQPPDPAYTTPGPCGVREMLVSPLQLPSETGCGYHCALEVHMHAPAYTSGTSCPGAPYPVVVFFSGFQLSSSYYTSYAERLASWGFAVVQYDLALLTIVADEVEVGYFPYLLKHVTSQPSVQGLLDLSQLATAGHSRGAKLAALHLAGTPGVVSAFLIDPVDSSSFSPPSPQNPSAAEALRGKHKQLAIAGAGVSGPCNPANSNYSVFWDVAGPGSWLELVPQAGHMQFTNISNGLIARALDLICHTGKTNHEHVIELTAPALVAWMDATLRGKAGSVAAKYATAGHMLQQQHVTTLVQQETQQQWEGQPQLQQLRHLLWASDAAPPDADAKLVLQSMQSQRRHEAVGSLTAFLSWVSQEQLAGEITFAIKQ